MKNDERNYNIYAYIKQCYIFKYDSEKNKFLLFYSFLADI